MSERRNLGTLAIAGIFILATLIAATLIYSMLSGPPLRARINLLTYGRVFVELTDSSTSGKWPEHADEFVWKFVYSGGQYVGYIDNGAYFIPVHARSFQEKVDAAGLQLFSFLGALVCSGGVAVGSALALMWRSIGRLKIRKRRAALDISHKDAEPSP